MHTTSLLGRVRLVVYVISLALGSVFGVNHAQADEPDPGLRPAYGLVKLKAGFEPDPFSKKLEAGGPIKTKLGGVTQFVSRAPDFRLHYTAGEFILRIYVEAKGDTTLLINLPDKSWKANDDGGGGKNPSITFNKPQSGQYDIWVGTFGPKNVDNAILKISEKEALVVGGPKAKTITLIDVSYFNYTTTGKVEMRVFQPGQANPIYTASRPTKNLWNFDPRLCTWATGKKGVEVQFWWINPKVLGNDSHMGSILIGPDAPAGVASTFLEVGNLKNEETRKNNFKAVLKYRIDN